MNGFDKVQESLCGVCGINLRGKWSESASSFGLDGAHSGWLVLIGPPLCINHGGIVSSSAIAVFLEVSQLLAIAGLDSLV